MSLTVSTAVCDSFRVELFQGKHVFRALASPPTGHLFALLLLTSAAAGSGNYGPATTNVGTPGSGSPTTSNVGTDETTDTSGNVLYVPGGFAWSAGQNSDPSLDSGAHVAFISWSTNPSWGTNVSIVSRGAILYNVTAGNRAIGVFDFGGDKTTSLGTFTVQLPPANASSAILRLA